MSHTSPQPHSSRLPEETRALIGRDNAFDLLRYFFAFSLIAVHFCTLCGIEQFWPVAGGTRVKAFFVMSGFLVYNSLLRSRSLRSYFDKRVRRICPAYAGVIFFCFLTGLLLTSWPLADFLGSPQTWKYLFSNLLFLNSLQPTLPGVFEGQPEAAMNGALWSMKVEVAFYLLLPLLAWLLHRFPRQRLHLLLSLIALSLLYKAGCVWMADRTGDPLWNTLSHQYGTYQMYFCAGMLLLTFFPWFISHIKPVTLVAALTLVAQHWLPGLTWVEPLAFSSLIIGLAYLLRVFSFLRRYDNISYGLYLYHCPVIHILLHFRAERLGYAPMFLLTLAGTVLLALVSWHLVEKPLLRRRQPAQ